MNTSWHFTPGESKVLTWLTTCKSLFLYLGPHHLPALIISSPSVPYSITHSVPDTIASLLFLLTQPQDHCTYCSFCLVCSSPDISPSTVLDSNVTFSVESSPSTLFKIVNFLYIPGLSLFLSPHSSYTHHVFYLGQRACLSPSPSNLRLSVLLAIEDYLLKPSLLPYTSQNAMTLCMPLPAL